MSSFPSTPPENGNSHDRVVLETSPSDTRKYRHVTLSSNHLPVLLISDPTTDKSSATLSAQVGHLSDPPKIPGLAHFLEHMLFMGSTKYPGENDYNSYLSSHGGSSNAYTATEQTVYYFDVLSPHLGGALDRFARFFIDPLMRADAVGREVLAVDSENAKNVQNDSWRMYQLTKGLARDEHPFRKFGTGNASTLRDGDLTGHKAEKGLATSDAGEEMPEGEGEKVDESRVRILREALLEFHGNFYSANTMQVCLLGRESLDELEAMAVEHFGGVANKNLVPPAFPGTPYETDQTAKILHVVPIKDVRYVELVFPIEETNSYYRAKPTQYIAHLLGHESAGSVLAHLKQKGWANDLSAGGSNNCSDFSTFSVTVELTDAGLEYVEEVVEVIFAYINMMKETGPQEWILRESQTVSDNNFQFLSKRQPIDYTQTIASCMHLYPVLHILSGPYKVFDYEPGLITSIVEKLLPQNCMIFVVAKTFEGKTKKKEKWYGTDYDIADFSPEQMKKWTEASVLSDGMKELHYPARNDLICTDFNLRESVSNTRSVSKQDVPSLLMDTPCCRVFFKLDDTFKMPKLNVMMSMRSEVAYESPKSSNLTLIFVEVLKEHCMDFSYHASMASLHSVAYNAKSGIEMTITGYNHKLHVLLSKIVDEFKNFQSKVKENLFERIKDKTSKQFKNFYFKQPYQHAVYGADICMEEKKWTIQEKIDALPDLTIDDLKEFSERFLSKFHIEMLIHGNASKEEAKQIAATLLEGLNPEAPSELPVTQVVKLKQGNEYAYRFREFNEENTNSSIEILYQIGRTNIAETGMLVVVNYLINEPAFNELRTQESLGYIVHTSVKTNGNDIKSLLILIQSDSFDPDHCDKRVEEFLLRMRTTILEMNSEEFQANIGAVVEQYREKNKNLSEESSKYWQEIGRSSYNFRKHLLIAEEVEKITQPEALAFYDRYIAKSGKDRRKFSARVYGKNHVSSMDTILSDVTLIESLGDFKRDVGFYQTQEPFDFESMK
mmetsp:Transcript_33829/g.66784  ORF Transcript_33829/g.66784 Transcript_33829/m.66784 type:complete len:1007 (-) Transcript_33829:91-3111(-)